jgi:predicted DNA-binding transcriptional regulator AlpA
MTKSPHAPRIDCQLLTVREVAQLLKVHPRTVWRLSGLAEAGLNAFPAPLRLGLKTVRWRLSAIEQYVARLEEGGAA